MIPLEADKRTRILLAAINVFSLQGYHTAKIEDIAAKAQVGKGTVYEYFSSKKELFLEMLSHSSDIYMENLSRRLEQSTSAKESVGLIVKHHLKFMCESQGIARILTQGHVEMGGEIHEWFLRQRQRRLELVEGVLQKGIASGEFCITDVRTTAQMFLGAVGSVGFSFLESEVKENDIEQTAATVSRNFLEGIVRKTNG